MISLRGFADSPRSYSGASPSPVQSFARIPKRSGNLVEFPPAPIPNPKTEPHRRPKLAPDQIPERREDKKVSNRCGKQVLYLRMRKSESFFKSNKSIQGDYVAESLYWYPRNY